MPDVMAHFLCLDAQKCQYNSSGWPYIAPVVKVNKMKVAAAAKSIRFQLSDLWLVFAHQKITPTVLHDLGIEETCTLHGDFYHLLNEVWANHYHPSVYPTRKKFLAGILLPKIQEE
jgi:hypothetical protein